MNQFLSGLVFLAAGMLAVYFFRFWRETRDRFFGFFATAFALLGIERVALEFAYFPDETRSYVYLIRLLAFLIISFAIIDKNRSSR